MDRQRMKRPRASKYARYRSTRLTRALGAFPLKMRISYTWKIEGGLAGGTSTVGNLTGFLQASNDWASAKGLYASYRINKVLVQYIPNFGPQADSATVSTAFGVAYDNSNSAALTNINQIPDYENYMFGFPGTVANRYSVMKFKVRPINSSGPYNTNEATNYAGYLKCFMGDNIAFDGTTICTLVIQFYCIFSGVQ